MFSSRNLTSRDEAKISRAIYLLAFPYSLVCFLFSAIVHGVIAKLDFICGVLLLVCGSFMYWLAKQQEKE